MINVIDYILGLAQLHANDQLNMVYTIKFSDSSQLDDLFDNVKKKISALNSFYRGLYSPFLGFEDLSLYKRQGDVLLLNESKYRDIDLANYEFIKLDYLKGEHETEFIFTISHIIADGISVIAIAYYLLNNYNQDVITSYINYPLIINKFSNYLKQTSFRGSKLPKIFNYVKIFKHEPIVSLKKRDEGSVSVPDTVRTTFDKSVAREKSKKYRISREIYLLLKLAETIFKYRPDKDDGDKCLISLSKNIRLNAINFVDEELGNYSFRKIMRFNRPGNMSFEKFVEQYSGTLNDTSYLAGLIQEWLSLQKINRLPKTLLNLFAKSGIFNPSKFTATFTYLPLRSSILFPHEFLKTYNTRLIDYACFLRVVKKHVPSFLFYPDPKGDYFISLTFNQSFMDKAEAVRFLELYKNTLMEA